MSEAHSTPSPATGDGVRSRRAEIALNVLIVVLALFYGLAAALPKLLGTDATAESFDKVGWGDWFMYTLGALELLGAIALLIPILSGIAALAFIGLMIGATIFNLTVLDTPQAAIMTVILIVPFAFIARARRGQNTELLRRLRQRS